MADEVGKITITIENDGENNKVLLETTLSEGDTNLWIDRAKKMIVSGEASVVEQ